LLKKGSNSKEELVDRRIIGVMSGTQTSHSVVQSVPIWNSKAALINQVFGNSKYGFIFSRIRAIPYEPKIILG
jgi:hypothetical protein